jgi:cell division protein FtsL
MTNGRRRPWLTQLGACLAMGAALIASGIGVVLAKHEARQLFAELEELNRESDRLQVDWGRLQLEQSAHATNSLIESIARERLDLVQPDPSKLVVVEERPR